MIQLKLMLLLSLLQPCSLLHIWLFINLHNTTPTQLDFYFFLAPQIASSGDQKEKKYLKEEK